MPAPSPDAANSPAVAGIFFGGRWASILAGALMAALGLLTAARWLTGTSSESQREEIVQVPVPADATSVLPAKELTAPDPGDTP